jgi:hypothetical protein
MAADGSISLALRESTASGSSSNRDSFADTSCWAMPDAAETQDSIAAAHFPTSRFKAGGNNGSGSARSGAVAPECDSSWQSSEL